MTGFADRLAARAHARVLLPTHPGFGRAFADAIPGAVFTLLPHTGHLPQVETPEELLDAILGIGS